MSEYFIFNIEHATSKNHYFRKVVYTTKYSQLAIMSLLPGQDIGIEVHQVDQFIRIESGKRSFSVVTEKDKLVSLSSMNSLFKLVMALLLVFPQVLNIM